MDCQMPNMDGLEATRQIRKLDKTQPVIIGCTAHALLGQREICLESGMDDCPTKPYRSEQLLSVVQSHLGRNVPENPNRKSVPRAA
jgi:CheY-like chemotaxis protein